MFKNLFKKNNSVDISNTKSNSKLSPELKALVEQAPLQIMTHELFMHYMKDGLKDDPSNPAWQNQALYFWSKDEPFEKKSLPAEFDNYPRHYFIFNQLPPELKLSAGEVMPWFGMPGKGTKYFVSYQDNPVPIKLLLEKGVIKKVEVINFTESNASVLQDKQNHFFIMNQKRLQYKDGKFIHNNAEILFSDAFEKDLLTLVKINS